jgi:hypothetical protein
MKPLKKIHLRVAIGAAILMVALLIWIFQIDGMSYMSGRMR